MTDATALQAPPIRITDESVPEGKVIDFLTGRHVKDTPEEYVRQNIERDLVRRLSYNPVDCAPEFKIRVGSSNKRVDLAIFYPDTEHRQENIFIVIECKKPGSSYQSRQDGIEQCRSYVSACVNAKYGVWTNGDDRQCFAKRESPRGYHWDDIVEIPAFGQSEEDAQRPQRKDLAPATADNLMFAFRRCHNYIAGTDGMHKTEAFWELLKIVFCKVEDERSRTLDFFSTPSEATSTTSAHAAKTRIERLFQSKVVRKYPTIFPTSDSQSIQLKPSTVAYVVSQLQSYSLLRSAVDVKGKAYEEIVGSNLRGDRGEFFTPRNACKMAVNMINPQPGDRVLDPACGTGGFLITAMNHALDLIELDEQSTWANIDQPTEYEIRERDDRRIDYMSNCVYGLDLNPNLVRAAKMNMVMNNDGSGGMWQANSLSNPHEWPKDARSAISLGSIDVVVTNPPFGAHITIDDDQVLRQYDLAAVWDQGDDGTWEMRVDGDGNSILQRSQPPEILFIERCVQLLKPGEGRMAVVIPNGILNNPALGYVRQWLLMNTQLLAVVDMARELFQPRNDTQTSMVLARRLDDEEQAQATTQRLGYPVFMAVAETVGHDKRGNSIYRRTPEGEDVVVAKSETVPDVASEGPAPKYRTVEVKERLLDDELPEVARAYLHWLSEHQI